MDLTILATSWESFFNSPAWTTALVTIIGLLVISFAKAIIRIYGMGKKDKETEQEKLKNAIREFQADFEEEMKKDMRGYAAQIQKTVLDAAVKLIERELKDIDEAKQAAVDVKVLKTKIETEVNNALKDINNLKSVEDELRSINARLNRIEYNKDNVDLVRRSEK